MDENAKTVVCRCCGKPITIALQERRAPKPPMLLITCRERDCKLNDVTIAALEIEDYLARDLSDKMSINK